MDKSGISNPPLNVQFETSTKSLVQIANPTVLEKPGVLMLHPIYQLLFGEYNPDFTDPYLKLTENQIAVNYKTYRSNDADDMQAIVDGKLTPGIFSKKCVLSNVQGYGPPSYSFLSMSLIQV